MPLQLLSQGAEWFFNENTVSAEMCLHHLMSSLEKEDITGGREIPGAQLLVLKHIRPLVLSDRSSSLVLDCLEFAIAEDHIMAAGHYRLLHTLKALLLQGIDQAIVSMRTTLTFQCRGNIWRNLPSGGFCTVSCDHFLEVPRGASAQSSVTFY
jgi:hypothetical protein